MSYWILTEAGRVIARTTVQHITNLELTTDKVKQRCTQYDQRVAEVLSDANHIIPHGEDKDPDFVNEFNNVVSDDQVPEEDDNFTPDVFDDTYLRMEIALPRGGGDQEDVQFAKVTKRLRDKEGRSYQWTCMSKFF